MLPKNGAVYRLMLIIDGVIGMLLGAVLVCAKVPLLSKDMNGKEHNLLAEARGKVCALVFISHDCPVCNIYAPELRRIAATYKGRKVVFDVLYAEPGLTPAAAKGHAKAYGLTGYRLYLDPNGKQAAACQVDITPEVAVYNARGAQIYRGRIDDRFQSFGKQRSHPTTHEFRSALDAALRNKVVTPSVTPSVGCYIARG